MTARIVRVTQQPTRVVRVTDPEPPQIVRVGLVGATGEPGSAANSYTHLQPTPALLWTVNHNLGIRPSVDVFNSGSQEVMAEVQHLSENQTLISFVVPTAGFARLN